jgi:hypothetical protein
MMSNSIRRQIERSCREWPQRLSAESWRLYQQIIGAAQGQGIGFAIGGGLALGVYTGTWRDTKDIDLYVRPKDRDLLVQIAVDAGLRDYYECQPYDRKWIHRSYGYDTIVDVIWSMANQRAVVEQDWLSGPKATIDGLEVQFLPPEYLLWSKLYVLQRDRCDWPDAMNLLHAVGPDLDWSRLLAKVEQDSELLGGLLATFRWLNPVRAAALPDWIWPRVGLSGCEQDGLEADVKRRADLLDTRSWYTPAMEGQRRISDAVNMESDPC